MLFTILKEPFPKHRFIYFGSLSSSVVSLSRLLSKLSIPHAHGYTRTQVHMFVFLPLESSVLVVYCMCSNLYLTHVVVVVFSFSSLADINHIVEKRNTDATSVVVVVVAIFLYFLRRFIWCVLGSCADQAIYSMQCVHISSILFDILTLSQISHFVLLPQYHNYHYTIQSPLEFLCYLFSILFVSTISTRYHSSVSFSLLRETILFSRKCALHSMLLSH